MKYHVAGAPDGSEPRSMRKFYRFSVMNPVTLSSACTAVMGTPFVELQLVNTTQVIYLHAEYVHSAQYPSLPFSCAMSDGGGGGGDDDILLDEYCVVLLLKLVIYM